MSDWKVIDEGNDVERPVDSRAEAEETVEELKEIVESAGGNPDNIKVQSPKGEERANITADGNVVQQGGKADGGTEVVDPTPDEAPPENIESDTDGYDLPDRQLTDDPIEWLQQGSGELTTNIKGTTVITKKGFRVLQHKYDISTSSDVVVGPEENDYTFCRVKARAEMPDGRYAEAHASAHTDRGDDHFLLVSMADTRAKSRALSDVTGVGAVAIEEMAGVDPNK